MRNLFPRGEKQSPGAAHGLVEQVKQMVLVIVQPVDILDQQSFLPRL